MRKLTQHPIKVGVALFFAVLVGVRFVLGPIVCNDGWASPSIGLQVACSSHGGVGYWKNSVALFLALFFGGGVGWKLYERKRQLERALLAAEIAKTAERLRTEANAQAALYQASSGTHGAPLCPLCGSTMRQRVARRGKRQGSNFWGCSTYPRCKGSRPV